MSSSANGINIGKGRTRTISITSGKGGVGKSTLVANLALSLSRSGQRILVLDGDLGMANLDILFGVSARNQLDRVLFEDIPISEALVSVGPNIDLIPGGSGIYELQRLPASMKQYLMDKINQLHTSYDLMFIDTAPGIDDNVLYLNSAAGEIVVVVTPDPASVTDAYALIKVLHSRCRENRFSILCNMVRDEKEGLQVFRRLSEVADRFLCVSLDYRGFVPADPNMAKATKLQQLVLDAEPRSPASQAIRGIGEKFSGFEHLSEAKGGIQFFWRQLVGVA
ncbi:MAG: MinD/ParA family protein [Bdellovibrionales bacterium]|nr:MinD/ParA family protein [Bdellovibrionales bacterium]